MDERHDDIDDLLRSAAVARPTAEFEEELLLRMKDELTATRELTIVDDDVDVDVELAPDASAGPVRTLRRPRLLIAAAVVALVAFTGWVLGADDATTDTEPAEATDPEIGPTANPPTIEMIDAACRTHLPTLLAFDAADNPTGFDAIAERRVWIAPVEEAIVDLVSSLDGATDPVAVEVRAELRTVGEQVAERIDRLDDRNDPSAGAIVDTLADRALVAASRLSTIGALDCAADSD